MLKRNQVFIIAEAGVNHNGSLSRAKAMVDAAGRAGADAIKFQTFQTEELVTRDAPGAGYQKKNSKGRNQFEMLKKLELSADSFKKLFRYCRKQKIMFMATPFDLKSAFFLYKLGVAIFKIGSGDLTNLPFLSQIARYKKPIILSTGMSSLDEVREAVQVVRACGNQHIILLHCTSNYPAAYTDVNLRALQTLKQEFGLSVGYSDHTPGIEVAIAAAALGAEVIEKHFTLDKNFAGPDHQASLEPQELKNLVDAVRNIEKSLGDGLKVPCGSEEEVKRVARRSIVMARDISAGTKIRRNMLAIKRPGTGIVPKEFNNLIGRKVLTNLKKDQILSWNLLA